MSLLPGQVLPADIPIGQADEDGKVTINHDWWLLIYNLCLQVLGINNSGLPASALQDLASADADAIDADAIAVRQPASNLTLSIPDPDPALPSSLLLAPLALLEDPVIPRVTTKNDGLVPSVGLANANLASVAARTLKGNRTNAGATPADLTVSQTVLLLGSSQAGLRFDYQTASVSGAGATDVYRFTDDTGAVVNNSVGGVFDVIAEDHSTGANQTIYQLWLGSAANGTTNATLTPLQRLLRGTDPGTSATPFSLANDGVGGAVKLQFTKNAAIAQVDLKITFHGVSSP